MHLMCAWRRPGQTEDRKARCLVRMPEGAHLIHILPWWTVIKVFIIAFLHMCGQINSILWYIVCRPTINSGGYYEVTFMTFNALRHNALWGFNDQSHGTTPDCWLDNPKQAIIILITRYMRVAQREKPISACPFGVILNSASNIGVV